MSGDTKKGTVIIAEAGTNHLGKLNKAKDLVELAANCGADVVKFQCFTDYVSELTMFCWIKGDDARVERWRKSYMPLQDWWSLREHCKTMGVDLLLSCFENQTVHWQDILELPVAKVASRAAITYPYQISKANYFIVSDGMIPDDSELFLPKNCVRMQCTAEYPAEVPWDGVTPCYSDHSGQEFLAIDAISRGCPIVEVHFHYAKWLAGPDEPVTKSADQLKTICRSRDYYDRQRLVG